MAGDKGGNEFGFGDKNGLKGFLRGISGGFRDLGAKPYNRSSFQFLNFSQKFS